MFFCYLLIVLKFISSSSAIESSRNGHASESKNRTRRDLAYQNSLRNHLSTHYSAKTHRNSPYSSKTGMREPHSIFHRARNFQPVFGLENFNWLHLLCIVFWILYSAFSMANFQAMRAQEELAAMVAMKQTAKARREARQNAMLTRISQLKRECICRLYCRG